MAQVFSSLKILAGDSQNRKTTQGVCTARSSVVHSPLPKASKPQAHIVMPPRRNDCQNHLITISFDPGSCQTFLQESHNSKIILYLKGDGGTAKNCNRFPERNRCAHFQENCYVHFERVYESQTPTANHHRQTVHSVGNLLHSGLGNLSHGLNSVNLRNLHRPLLDHHLQYLVVKKLFFSCLQWRRKVVENMPERDFWTTEHCQRFKFV